MPAFVLALCEGSKNVDPLDKASNLLGASCKTFTSGSMRKFAIHTSTCKTRVKIATVSTVRYGKTS